MKKEIVPNEERMKNHRAKMNCSCTLAEMKTYNEWKALNEFVAEGQKSVTSILVDKSKGTIREEAVRTGKPESEVFPFKPTKMFCKCQLVKKKEKPHKNTQKTTKSKGITTNLQFLKKRFYDYSKQERGIAILLLKIHTKQEDTEKAFKILGKMEGMNLLLSYLSRGLSYNEREVKSYLALKENYDLNLLSRINFKDIGSFYKALLVAEDLERNWYSN